MPNAVPHGDSRVEDRPLVFAGGRYGGLDGCLNVRAQDACSAGSPAAGHRDLKEWTALVQRLEPVIERMQVGCVILDVDSRMVAWNAAARGLFSRELGEVLGHSPGGSLVPRAGWSDFESIYRQAGLAGLSTSAVLEHDGPGGERVACEWRVAALARPDGSVAGYTAMVSPRGSVPAEDPLGPALEHKWETVFDQTPVPTFLLTSEGRIWKANQAARVLFGRNSDDVGGRTLAELLACPEGQPGQGLCGGTPRCHRCGLGATLLEDHGLGETLNRREIRQIIPNAGGSYEARLLVSSSTVQRDGQSMRLVSLEDVTERRRNEDQLREQAMLLAAAEDAICIVDLAGNIQFWSPGAERLYGWGSSEAVNRPVSDVIFGGAGYIWSGLRGILLEKGNWEGDLEPFSRKKEALSVRARAWVMRDGDAMAASIVIVANDLTAKRQLEKQLLRAQRLESVGTLACGIAHDLNNVLTPVQMAAELLRPAVAGTDSERFLNLLVRSAARGGEITRQLLRFGRGNESGHASVDLKSLLKETVKILSGTLPKSIQVRGVIPDDLRPVMGDVTQVHQVLLNLCVNARDAMPDGGVILVRAQNRDLDETEAQAIPGGRSGNYVMLSVRDTGVGIPQEVLEKMFDPFFTTKPPGMGSGLGLSTVQGIVRSHRGFVQVNTEVGRGTVFSVYLPVSSYHPSIPVPTESVPAAAGQNQSVLVIEDEPAILELIQTGLERAGYRVLTATDGAEGISVFGKHHADISVVVVDMMLPLIDGATSIRMFRRLVPEMEIVAISGLPSLQAAASESANRRVTFLPKPIRLEEIVTAVGNAVIRRNAQEAGSGH
jgi:PAS domain S-box-containing protein